MGKLFNRNNLTTALELAGCAAIVVGVGLVFGLGVALFSAGLLAIGVGYLEGRKP